MRVLKAHAYGNDFLFVRRDEMPPDPAALARAMCNRHEGVGADGLIFYGEQPRGGTMRLLNADGSPSELSGNGLRCLAAVIAASQHLEPGVTVTVESDAG